MRGRLCLIFEAEPRGAVRSQAEPGNERIGHSGGGKHGPAGCAI